MYTTRLLSPILGFSVASKVLATPVNIRIAEDDISPGDSDSHITFSDDVLPPNYIAADFNPPAGFDWEDTADLDQSFIGSNYTWPVNTTDNPEYTIKPNLADEDKHFQIYFMTYDVTGCTHGGCWDQSVRRYSVDSSCHGGRCGAKAFMDHDWEAHLCDKKLTACGIEYVLKYTGTQGSCMRYKWFHGRGFHYWVKYAHLTRGGKNVGECLVWNKIRTAKHCAFGPWGMDSMLKCWVHR
ncbi:hypothetical protein B0I35DRAFT_446349 [Stachybotrys elegans]|uniref:Uncharacterized protein n=1 Tax=Stachybotrys elegans TaxID=80388 RepID=A0A8K0SGV4_9HYPO|nr:hypothetical protein B0I35DRAFT_446349 [Stachybotrys elegans]